MPMEKNFRVKANLFEYQQIGSQFLAEHHRGGLIDEPGLGKTMQTLATVINYEQLPALIFAPRSSMGVWREEINKWVEGVDPEDVLIYAGQIYKRNKMQQLDLKKARFVITSYQIGTEILDFQCWGAIICDEYHSVGLLNHRTKTYKAFNQSLTKKQLTVPFYVLSGTPYTKGPQDFFAVLHLFEPKNIAYKSYWRFVSQHCIVLENGFGYKEICTRPRNPEHFRALLQQHFLRRRKIEVLDQLPTKLRQIVPIEMSDRQRQLYNELEMDLMAAFKNELTILMSPLDKLIKLRQLLISPQLIDETEDDIGGGLSALLEHVSLDFDAGHNVLIFTPFVKGVELIAKTLSNQLKCSTHKMHGQLKLKTGTTASDIAIAFQRDPAAHKAIVSTIKLGQSWTATAANVVYFLGYEWSAVENGQAEDRVHRIGQKKSVVCKYFKYNETIDQDILGRVLDKELGFAASLDEKQFWEILKRRFNINRPITNNATINKED